MALRDDGRIVFWGPQASYPQLNVTNAVAIGAERNRAHALLADGTVRSWDMAASGQELPVPDSVTNVVQIAAGITHCLALRADGQVGSGPVSRRVRHVPLESSAISASEYSNWCAFDGSVVHWFRASRKRRV